MPSQPHALRLLLKLSELVSSMNHRDVQHVQSQGQMNGFPLEVHRAIWGTWEDNATKTPPSFKHLEGKICTALPSSPRLLQYNVPLLSSETCIFSPLLILCGIPVHRVAWGGGPRTSFCMHRKVKHNDDADCRHK
ncbi:Hypothetical predicted protein [Lynx pardinus]|uniref:Uncharacterized protein n=1 Tax=Lynx pardinus TaxID=191816 RepID=A0A485MGH3_LYNPA|nr:Hypothetical predicted protein [Lynx pardinus]